jgi:hypothetical protein
MMQRSLPGLEHSNPKDFAMTRPMTKRQFPSAIVSSTLGTTLISIVAVCLVTSSAFSPVVATSDNAKFENAKPYKPSGRLYRLSPIPAGADWAS